MSTWERLNGGTDNIWSGMEMFTLSFSRLTLFLKQYPDKNQFCIAKNRETEPLIAIISGLHDVSETRGQGARRSPAGAWGTFNFSNHISVSPGNLLPEISIHFRNWIDELWWTVNGFEFDFCSFVFKTRLTESVSHQMITSFFLIVLWILHTNLTLLVE